MSPTSVNNLRKFVGVLPTPQPFVCSVLMTTSETELAAEDRVMLFIDGSNFYHGLKTTGSNRISFQKFADKLCHGRKLVSIEYYNCPLNQQHDPNGYSGQLRFFNAIKKIPKLNLHLARLVPRRDVTKKHTAIIEKGLDVMLAIHMFKHAISDNYDVAILVSGDGDFAPAVELIRRAYKKRIEVANFETTRSDYLVSVCDKLWELDKEDLKTCQV